MNQWTKPHTESRLSEKQFYWHLLIGLALSLFAIASIWQSGSSMLAYNHQNYVHLIILQGPYGSKLHFEQDHGQFNIRTTPSNQYLIWQGIHTDIRLFSNTKNLETLKSQLEALRRQEQSIAYQMSSGHLVFIIILTLATGQWIHLYSKLTNRRKQLKLNKLHKA